MFFVNNKNAIFLKCQAEPVEAVVFIQTRLRQAQAAAKKTWNYI